MAWEMILATRRGASPLTGLQTRSSIVDLARFRALRLECLSSERPVFSMKSFLIVLPEEQLASFHFLVNGLALARRPTSSSSPCCNPR